MVLNCWKKSTEQAQIHIILRDSGIAVHCLYQRELERNLISVYKRAEKTKGSSIWLLSDESTVWKSRKLYVLESVENVWEWVLWAIWLQRLVKTNPKTMHQPKLRRNNSWCTLLWCCPQFYFKQFCAIWLLISGCSRMYKSVCGLPRCIRRICAAFSEDNLQNKR